jgi:anaerobic magnesium-protoporphyrin IX monomethyl ester cyclase
MNNKKKILLVKPISEVNYVISPPLGLGYLASALINQGFFVDIVDCAKSNLTYEEFMSRIFRRDYDFIGFTLFSHEIDSVKRHCYLIKREFPDVKIIVGGPHPSGDPIGTMKYLEQVDYAFIGECELALPMFMSLNEIQLKSPECLENIPNLVWRLPEKPLTIIVNKSQVIEDLDQLSSPAWDLLDLVSYPNRPHGTFTKKNKVAPIIVSRGCPYQCTFCAAFTITGRKMRVRSVEKVLEEVKYLYEVHGIEEFHIEDDNFTFSKEYVKRFCEGLIREKIDIVWSCPNGVRINSLDKETVCLMEKSGCYSLALGIESGSDNILRMVNKSLSTTKIKEKLELIKSNTKIKLTGFFLIGLPGETVSDIIETIRFSRSLPLDRASFAYAMPLPGSVLWKDWKLNNSTQNHEYNDFVYYKKAVLSDIDQKVIKRLHRSANLGFYLRPRIILGMLSEIQSVDQLRSLLLRFIGIFFK